MEKEQIDKGPAVEGKLAVPHNKVEKRGQTMWTDDKGALHKELKAPKDVKVKTETPDYIKLQEEVLNGADPIKASIKYQEKK